MPQSQIIRSPDDFNTSVINRDRSQYDQRTTYFSDHRSGARPMIARSPGYFVASGCVRMNFKSHLKFYPRSGMGKNQVEIEKRSDDQRTVIPRRSRDIGFVVIVSWRVIVRRPSGNQT
ncbi:hypothetical protein DPMN_014965, partial [Dreissena polymorpha]